MIREHKNVSGMDCSPKEIASLYPHYILDCRIKEKVQTLEGRTTRMWDVSARDVHFGMRTIINQYFDGVLRTQFHKGVDCSINDEGKHIIIRCHKED